MSTRTARPVLPIALCATVLSISAGCGGSPVAPTPVAQTENFTGTLQPLGFDVKTFTIVYTQGSSDLSVTVNSLSTVAGSTPVTGITIGVGVGTMSGATCSLQLQTPVATLGQELFAPNGASAGYVLCANLRLSNGINRVQLHADRARDVLDDGQALLRHCGPKAQSHRWLNHSDGRSSFDVVGTDRQNGIASGGPTTYSTYDYDGFRPNKGDEQNYMWIGARPPALADYAKCSRSGSRRSRSWRRPPARRRMASKSTTTSSNACNRRTCHRLPATTASHTRPPI